MMEKERNYPVGIQTFSEIIREGYVYIDKTDLMWRMQNKRKYIFLSRPRRFGKSLLSSTLHSFFEGRRELFTGLKVMDLEKSWEKYPVIHLDLSEAKDMDTANELREKLRFLTKPFYRFEDSGYSKMSPGTILSDLIQKLYQETGKQVVVIIDEYDAPLLDLLHESPILSEMRKVMQEFYMPLKAKEQYIRFCFITGITKFSQLSIFSTINNLTNITMWPEFSAICGITEKELSEQMQDDIAALAERQSLSSNEMHAKLKMQYDGYHFSEDSEEVYNPFSLLKAFDSKKIGNYWFESGTSSFLISEMKHFRTDIMSFDHLEVPSTAFDQPTEAMDDALPLLYQSGYLTIKDYNPELDIYTLSIPNQEVRVGYTKGLLPSYVGLKATDVQTGFAAKFWIALKKNDIDLAMREMKSYMVGIPYVEGFKEKLKETANAEGFYEYTMYLIFSMLNVYVKTQVKCAGGRTDVVIWMPEVIYVFELKVSGTADKAIQQIDDHGYAIPYQTDGRKVVKVGVKFDKETRTPINWTIKYE